MRKGNVKRSTKETNIDLSINLDGTGISNIKTTIPFFDHMLELFAKHSLCDLKIKAKGDTKVDEHHLIEDMAIVLGAAVKNALKDKKGIKRYGSIILPMDNTLVEVAIDISGRPYFVSNLDDYTKSFSKDDKDRYEMYEHFFDSLSINSGMTLHINLKYGKNFHHIIEAIFKAFARSLKDAVSIDKREKGIPSSKGKL